MLSISIICVGKLKEKFWRDACNEYAKRLSSFCKFNIIEADEYTAPDNASPAQIQNVIENEGKRIAAKLNKNTAVIAMCIEGRQMPSEKLSQSINDLAVKGVSSIAFVIGGSWGLAEDIKKRAVLRLSMSEMTFPHQLARVMLCEQIYRAFQISSGGRYHK